MAWAGRDGAGRSRQQHRQGRGPACRTRPLTLPRRLALLAPQSLFPDLHRDCSAFVRHKDTMMSPSCLKTFGVPYMRAAQRPNEFVVLNAAGERLGGHAQQVLLKKNVNCY
jgi:hypothetical protein